MIDEKIIELYFRRSEDAISETDKKYGTYCRSIAYNILSNKEDVEECINDIYLKIWSLIPPTQPKSFSAFIGKITRHHSIDIWRKMNTEKRGKGEINLALNELSECIPCKDNPEKQVEAKELESVIVRFLDTLSANDRIVFMKRYWFMQSLPMIAGELNISVSKVKSNLFRTRKKLRKYLEMEGYYE